MKIFIIISCWPQSLETGVDILSRKQLNHTVVSFLFSVLFVFGFWGSLWCGIRYFIVAKHFFYKVTFFFIFSFSFFFFRLINYYLITWSMQQNTNLSKTLITLQWIIKWSWCVDCIVLPQGSTKLFIKYLFLLIRR